MGDNRIYNFEVKGKYLDQFDHQETKEVYARLFRKAFESELALDKDLFDFNEVELEDFLANKLKPKTKESARTYCNVIANYIQWAIDNPKISKTNNIINPMKRRQEYFFEFVQNRKMYFSMEEKQAIIKSLVNKQDSFIIEGLWNGIQGTKVSELVNLRINDVDSINRKISIRDDNNNITRVISFSDKEETDIFEMAILANKEREYYKKNGEVDYSSNVKDVAELSESEYVLKSAKTSRHGGKEGGEKVSHFTVYNRLEMIRSLEDFEEYNDALTTKNIVRSGMIYMALKLFDRDHELGTKQIKEICTRFDIKYKWSLRDFLNLEILEELYPEEMDRIKKEITTAH